MQFARYSRQRIETIAAQLRQYLAQANDRGIDQSLADLQDALSELNREVRQYYSDDEDDDLFGSIRNVFTGERDRDREPYGRESRPYSGGGSSNRKRPTYQDNWDEEDDNWL
jgi:molecular chaperone DnaK